VGGGVGGAVVRAFGEGDDEAVGGEEGGHGCAAEEDRDGWAGAATGEEGADGEGDADGDFFHRDGGMDSSQSKQGKVDGGEQAESAADDENVAIQFWCQGGEQQYGREDHEGAEQSPVSPGELMPRGEPVGVGGAEGVVEAIGEIDEPYGEEEGERGVPADRRAIFPGNQKCPPEGDEWGDEPEE